MHKASTSAPRSAKLAGVGRILLWSGGSLWIGRSGAATSVHAHHAVQLTLSHPQDSVRLRTADEDWILCRAALIAANEPHAFAGDGQLVANVFVEPESRDGQALQQLCREARLLPLATDTLHESVAVLFKAYDDKADDNVLVTYARSVVETLAAVTSCTVLMDSRIQRSLEHVRKHVADQSITLAATAAIANLSPDRFRHLFLAQTGIRFRPYVLWLRIEIALAAYAAHSNLTEAAQAGGFADSAHFSRTFKNMFGVTPSSIHID